VDKVLMTMAGEVNGAAKGLLRSGKGQGSESETGFAAFTELLGHQLRDGAKDAAASAESASPQGSDLVDWLAAMGIDLAAQLETQPDLSLPDLDVDALLSGDLSIADAESLGLTQQQMEQLQQLLLDGKNMPLPADWLQSLRQMVTDLVQVWKQDYRQQFMQSAGAMQTVMNRLAARLPLHGSGQDAEVLSRESGGEPGLPQQVMRALLREGLPDPTLSDRGPNQAAFNTHAQLRALLSPGKTPAIKQMGEQIGDQALPDARLRGQAIKDMLRQLSDSGPRLAPMTGAAPGQAGLQGVSPSSGAALGSGVVDLPRLELHPRSQAWADAFGQRIQIMAGQQIQQARIQLRPAHLGPIEVRIAIENDQAKVQFQAPHALTRDAIEGAIPRLRELLSEQQLNLASVDVSGGRHSRADAGGQDGAFGRSMDDQWQGGEESDSDAGAAVAQRVQRASDGLLDDYA
jgi:hypothetical protein